MAAKKQSNAAPAQKEWYTLCNDKCGGKEQRVLFALVVGVGGRKKRTMCAGCREILPDSAKTYKL